MRSARRAGWSAGRPWPRREPQGPRRHRDRRRARRPRRGARLPRLRGRARRPGEGGGHPRRQRLPRRNGGGGGGGLPQGGGGDPGGERRRRRAQRGAPARPRTPADVPRQRRSPDRRRSAGAGGLSRRARRGRPRRPEARLRGRDAPALRAALPAAAPAAHAPAAPREALRGQRARPPPSDGRRPARPDQGGRVRPRSLPALHRRARKPAAGEIDARIFFGPDDVDWCLRIRRAGLQVAYHPAATVVHGYRRTSAARPASRIALRQLAAFARFQWAWRGERARLIQQGREMDARAGQFEAPE